MCDVGRPSEVYSGDAWLPWEEDVRVDYELAFGAVRGRTEKVQEEEQGPMGQSGEL